MRAVVIGAGVIGVTSAWYLSEAGFDVVVVDAGAGPGLETSFANGGQISACHTQPWAGPSAPGQLIRWLGRDDAPLKTHPWRWDPALWRWGLTFLKNCTEAAFVRNMERAIRPALYSRALLKDLRPALNLSYRARAAGILKIYRSERAFAEGLKALEMARPWGLEQVVLTSADCVALEPALAGAAASLAGGIFSPDDESGDARQFTTALASRLEQRGVRLRFTTRVTGFERTGGGASRVLTDAGDVTADVVVLAAGVGAAALGRLLGVRLPVYPVKGYSLTLPVGDHAPGAPLVSITDEERRMVYSRLGGDLRSAGTAEFIGFDRTLSPARVALIRRESRALFPDAGDFNRADPWCGLRPVTPDNAPILGPVPGLANVFLNVGHGTLGWTQACGCGRVIADLAAGKTPEIDLTGLGPERFSI